MKDSHIAWTHHTFNGWIGCTRVSEECDRCYAAALDARYGYTKNGWGKGAPRKLRPDSAWREPLQWNNEAAEMGTRSRVFCASLADVFDAEVPPEWRARLFELVAATPSLDWLLLTKRPQLIRRQLEAIDVWKGMPLPNVWIGFSAGNQRNFDSRWRHVRTIPAAVRFCSYEPAIGPLVLPQHCQGNLHWLICGGETAQQKEQSRRMLPAWSRAIRDQSKKMGIPFFFKQWGNWIPTPAGDQRWFGKTAAFYREKSHMLDGTEHKQFPTSSSNKYQLL